MKIKFVNHASFIVEHNGTSIITDPWLEGRVFNNGWELLSKSKFSYDDFKDIDYLWFSHEHPDHFFPPNLKKIPAEIKKNITVLFQKTIDGRVSEYCRKSGFKNVIELEKGNFFSLADDFKILCEAFKEGDSWICYKCDGLTILNTNDCGIVNKTEAFDIKNKVGNVDILLTQFSYAYWAGNKEDIAYRKSIAARKLDRLKFQCDIFEPRITIPIASFVYFCHEENFYLNDSVNTAGKTFEFIKTNTKTEPVVLYNGDEYEYLQKWDSSKAIEKYKADFEYVLQHKSELLEKNKPVPAEELINASKQFTLHLRSSSNFVVKSILKNVRIHLSDYDKTYLLTLQEGIIEKQIPKEKCDVSLSSESLLFCLKFPYGLDTTQINGRLQKPKKGAYTRFYNFFRVDQQKSRGQEMTYSYLLDAGIRKIKIKLGLEQV